MKLPHPHQVSETPPLFRVKHLFFEPLVCPLTMCHFMIPLIILTSLFNFSCATALYPQLDYKLLECQVSPLNFVIFLLTPTSVLCTQKGFSRYVLVSVWLYSYQVDTSTLSTCVRELMLIFSAYDLPLRAFFSFLPTSWILWSTPSIHYPQFRPALC